MQVIRKSIRAFLHHTLMSSMLRRWSQEQNLDTGLTCSHSLGVSFSYATAAVAHIQQVVSFSAANQDPISLISYRLFYDS